MNIHLPCLLLLLLLLSRFSLVRLCGTHRRQPTRLSIPGILQARIPGWVAISFSNAWKWKGKVKSLSCVRLFATPWTAVHQAPLHGIFQATSLGNTITGFHLLAFYPGFCIHCGSKTCQWLSSWRSVGRTLVFVRFECQEYMNFIKSIWMHKTHPSFPPHVLEKF